MAEYRLLPDKPVEIIEVAKPAAFGHQHHDLALLSHFLDRIEHDDTADGGVADAYLSGAVAFAALESMPEGRPVSIPPHDA